MISGFVLSVYCFSRWNSLEEIAAPRLREGLHGAILPRSGSGTDSQRVAVNLVDAQDGFALVLALGGLGCLSVLGFFVGSILMTPSKMICPFFFTHARPVSSTMNAMPSIFASLSFLPSRSAATTIHVPVNALRSFLIASSVVIMG